MNDGTGYKGGGSAGVPGTQSAAYGTGEAALPDLLAEFDERLRGAAPGAAAGPDDASDARLRGAMDCLRLLESVFPRRTSDAGNPATIGRFQILRRLGQGGFGIVYLAHDPHLGRAVALKVPHDNGGWDSGKLDRFRREAVAAAALDHPNIVPVYDAGEADGRQFIAMAYCPGITLGEWLARQPRPVDARHAADLVRVIADAVHHAHERGVVHRDLKPANILLIERGGAAGVLAGGAATGALHDYQAKVSDFGLAKRLDDATITHTGSITGTPNYMAPEQVAGDAGQVGPASDVYALGAILYELLTGRAPHLGDSALATLYSVRHVEPVAPSRLRTSLSRDLETICVKCLEKLACDRYTSARELSEELSRYLDGTPIRARPVTPPIRVARWCRRKPLVTGLAAALFLALSLGAAGLAIHRNRVRHDEAEIMERSREAADAWRAAEASFARATRAAAAADAHLQSNVATADRLLDMSDGLLRQPRLDARGRAALEELISSYQRFLDDKDDHPVTRRRSSMALLRVAALCRLLGQYERADRLLAHAGERLTALSEAEPANLDYKYALVLVYSAEAANERRGGLAADIARAATTYEKALAGAESLVAAAPQRLEFLLCKRYTLDNLGRTQIINGRLDRAEAAFRAALELQQVLTAAASHDPDRRAELAGALECMSQIEQARDHLTAAQDWCQQAIDVQKQLVEESPGNRGYRSGLGWMHGRAAEIAKLLGRLSDADAYCRESTRLYEQTSHEFPSDHDSLQMLARFLALRAEINLQQRNAAGAVEAAGQAASIRGYLAGDSPGDPACRRELAYSLFILGNASNLAGDAPGAVRAFDRVMALHETLPDEFRGDSVYRNEIAWRSRDIGHLFRQLKDNARAEAAYRQAICHFVALSDGNADFAEPLRQEAATWRAMAAMFTAAKDFDAAHDPLERAAILDQQLTTTAAATDDDRRCLISDRRALANNWVIGGDSTWKKGDEARAEAAYRSALELAPDDPRALNGLAWLLTMCRDPTRRSPSEALELARRAAKASPRSTGALNTLGAALYRSGDYRACISVLDETIGLRGGGTADDWFFQAMARWCIGEKEAAFVDYQWAADWMAAQRSRNVTQQRLQEEAASLLGIPPDDQILNPKRLAQDRAR